MTTQPKSPGLIIADDFRGIYGDAYIVNDSDQSDRPDYYAIWHEGQWLRYRVHDIKAQLQENVEIMFSSKKQGPIVDEAYRIIKSRATFTLKTEWNASKKSIPFKDGVKSLCLKTCDIIDTPKEDKMLYRFPVDSETYANTDITKTRLHGFMEDWFPEPDFRRFLQRFVGQALAGNPSRAFVDLFGPGRNGKGTILAYIAASFGEYYGTIDKSYLTIKGANKHESGLVQLHHKRFIANDAEFSNADVLNEGIINSISAGDKKETSEKGGRTFVVRPKCGLMIHSNTKLNINADSDGLRDRWKTVQCDFYVPDDKKIESDEMDEIIEAEGPATLKYWVEGLRQYRADRFNPLGKVAEATAEYFAEEDKVMRILETYCAVEVGAEVKIADIFALMKLLGDQSFKSPDKFRKMAQTSPHRGILDKNGSRQWVFRNWRIKSSGEMGMSVGSAPRATEDVPDPKAMKEQMLKLATGDK